MQDRPTAPELLDAMAAHLFSEVRDWVPRERRFQVLVLANLCSVLGRELRAGDVPTRADLASFNALLGCEPGRTSLGSEDQPRDETGLAAQDEQAVLEAEAREAASELAARIRSGDLDDELPAVVAELRAHVARKLEIARPGYTNPPPGP